MKFVAFLVRLTPSQYAWITDEAERTGESKAVVTRRIIARVIANDTARKAAA